MKIRYTLPIVFAFAFPQLVMPLQAQVVPGTGQQIVEVFDDFEDPNWSFTLNLPKSSSNIDKVERHPSGFSNNRTFLESMYRGTPDFVRRVDTPPGGIVGSKGALAMQTLNSGIPGQISGTFQQDDLIAGVQQKLGYIMPVGWSPSYVCRVYMPPFDKWEQRHGSHFGFRADCTTTINKPNSVGKWFKTFGTHKALEQYWPGFFIQLNLAKASGQKEDSAIILIRSDELGHDVPGPKITRPGWWTLGLSFTPDGKVHYYAHEGVENLTAKDHLYSNFPYGYRCEQTSTYFFNIVNQDDGKSWSTRWIVDDPKVYVASGTYRPPVQAQMAQTPTATPPVAPQGPVPPVTLAPAATPTQAPAAGQVSLAKPAAAPVAATPAATAPKLNVQVPNLGLKVPTPSVPMLASKPTELGGTTPKEKPPEELPKATEKEPVKEPVQEPAKEAAKDPVKEPEAVQTPAPSPTPTPEASEEVAPTPTVQEPTTEVPATEVPEAVETDPESEIPSAPTES